MLEHSAVELKLLIAQGALSSSELLTACIKRIEAVNPAINAICATDYERALRTAQAMDERQAKGEALGLLHGLPVGIKDLQDTAGLLTTYGNIGRRGYVPNKDVLIVERIRQAGGIVTCKTNVPDMGAGANTRNPVWGATGNPFNPLLNAGGSSGGSAAALASNMLPLCTGSDTGGSLRIPAALCGVVGMRPSPGVVAYDGRPLGWSGLSVLGPMGRNVADTALQLQAIAGFHALDPLSYHLPEQHFWPIKPIDLKSLKVGFSADFGVCAVDPMIRRTFEQKLKLIDKEVSLCEPSHLHLAEADRVFDILRAEAFYAAFAEVYTRDPESLGVNARANVEMAANIKLADRAWAHLEQTKISRQISEALNHVDVIVAPTTPLSPFPWTIPHATEIDGISMRNYYQWLGLTYAVTLGTQPCITIPCGRDELGMPFGLQIITRLRDDARLLSIAAAFEAVLESRPIPDEAVLSQEQPILKSPVTHPPIDGQFSKEVHSNAV